MTWHIFVCPRCGTRVTGGGFDDPPACGMHFPERVEAECVEVVRFNTEAVTLTERDLSALRFAVMVVRGVEQGLEERHPDDPNSVTGTREGEATSDVLAAIVSRAERPR